MALRVIIIYVCFFSFTMPCRVNAFQAKGDTIGSRKHFDEGVVKFKRGDFQDALKDFEKSVELDHRSWNAYRMKAACERELRQFEKSVYDYNIAIRLNEKDWNSYFGRGITYYQLNNFEHALSDFNECILHDQNNPFLYRNRGLSFFFLNRYLDALADFNLYFAKGGKESIYYYYKASCFIKLSDDKPLYADSIIGLGKKYLQVKEKASAYGILGTGYYLKGDSAQSYNNFKRALQLDSMDADLYLKWGGVAVNFTDYKRANILLTKAAQKTKHPTRELYFWLGLSREGLKDTVNALNYFAKAIGLDSNWVAVYRERIDLVGSNPHNLTESIKDINNIIRLTIDPEEVPLLYSTRSLMHMMNHNSRKGFEDINKAISLSPKNPFNYLLRAFLRSSVEPNETLVIEDIDKAISLNKDYAEAYLLKSIFFKTKGDVNQSCRNYELAVKRGLNQSKEFKDYLCSNKEGHGSEHFTLQFTFAPYFQQKLYHSKRR